MTRVVPALLAIGLLLLGVLVGLAAVAIYAWWWGLLLAAVASISTLAALPPRWHTLLPFAVGWWIPLLVAWTPRREGDWAITGTALGYLLIALAMVVIVAAAFRVTLRWPVRSRPTPSPPAPGTAPRGAR